MSDAWIVVLAVGAVTWAIKALGPALIAGRRLPTRVTDLLGALGPAVLAGLVVTNTFAAGRHLQVDARSAGVAAALVAIALRAPLLAVVVAAAVVTALVRLA